MNNSEINNATEAAIPADAASENHSKKKKREPVFHIVKRPAITLTSSLLIRISAILTAFVLVGIITLIILGQNPFVAYKTMFVGVFGSNTVNSIRDTAILLCIALALTPAFKMKFWNIGAEGQVIAGALATAFCMYYFRALPTPLLLIVMFLAACLMGAIWGFLPAIFKAFWGTNETLFTLMMNSIAAYLTMFLMKFWNKTSDAVGKEILDPNGKIFNVFSGNQWIVIFTVLLIDIILFIYPKYSKQGYEISVVGESENTARYIGINVKKVIIRTMTISGLICGIAGFLIAAPAQNIARDIAGGQGFTAIMVAWLAKFNPLIMILSAFLFIFVSSGGREISTTLGLESAYADILIGILLFFIIGCEFFINYRIIPNAKAKSFIDKALRIFKKNKKEAE